MVSKKSAGCCGGPLADPERVHIFCCTKGVSVKSLEQARPTSVQANGLPVGVLAASPERARDYENEPAKPESHVESVTFICVLLPTVVSRIILDNHRVCRASPSPGSPATAGSPPSPPKGARGCPTITRDRTLPSQRNR